MDEYENNPQVEILEERLKLVETELQDALKRAEKAEKSLQAAPPPAPPLPPPPPPPLGDVTAPPNVPLRTKKLSRTMVPEIAATLGVKETNTNTSCDGKKTAIGKL